MNFSTLRTRRLINLVINALVITSLLMMGGISGYMADTATAAESSSPQSALSATVAPGFGPFNVASDEVIGNDGEVFRKPEGPGNEMGEAGKNGGLESDAPSVQETAPLVPGPIARGLSGKHLAAIRPPGSEAMTLGMDVSGWQPQVDWAGAWRNGARFAFVKASEGPWASNNYFAAQFAGAASVGMVRGAYSFALPNVSSGASQATALVLSGGGWAADGKTLPGVLDLEYSPTYAGTGTLAQKCYSMSPTELVRWAQDFSQTYASITGRFPIIYANYSFWQSCMGNSTQFNATNPLWIAAYGPAATGVLVPGGWKRYTFWQYADSGTFPGDQNAFNGSYSQLLELVGATHLQPLTAFQLVANANPGLGIPAGPISCGLSAGGCRQQFEFGDIYRTPSGLMTTVGDPIRKKYLANGGVSGSWGYPVTGQTCGVAAGTCRQDFQGGSSYLLPSKAVTLVSQPILAKWASHGAYGGAYGLPITELRCGFDTRGGCLQDFAGGSIYINPQSKAVAISGSMRSAFWKLQGHAGVLGYPVADEVCGLPGDGCVQSFETGSLGRYGAGNPVPVIGDMNTRYAFFGGPMGGLGMVKAGADCTLVGGGCRQEFVGGSLIKSTSNGVRAVTNPIQKIYDANGGVAGRLGYPTSDQICGMRGNACLQDFQKGSIYITPTKGTIAVPEPVRTKWWQSGGQSSPLGYPAAPLASPIVGGGSVQDFDAGSMVVTPTGVVFAVSGKVREHWWKSGAHTGTYGYPAGDQKCSAGKCTQKFTGGTISE